VIAKWHPFVPSKPASKNALPLFVAAVKSMVGCDVAMLNEYHVQFDDDISVSPAIKHGNVVDVPFLIAI